MKVIQQSRSGGVDIAQGDMVIHLGDEEIARIIQIRLGFERMTWADLVCCLAVWHKPNGIEQVSLEEVMRSGRQQQPGEIPGSLSGVGD